jgi:hypothetical protein
MTYRSEFEPIPRSANPQATSSLSLSMRLKSQLGDQSPFSSDTGWGCMIRSGQSLLANAIALVRLGRGQYMRPFSTTASITCLTSKKIGVKGSHSRKNAPYSETLPMTPSPLTPYIALFDMVPVPAASTQVSGSVHQQQLAAFSKSHIHIPPFLISLLTHGYLEH